VFTKITVLVEGRARVMVELLHLDTFSELHTDKLKVYSQILIFSIIEVIPTKIDIYNLCNVTNNLDTITVMRVYTFVLVSSGEVLKLTPLIVWTPGTKWGNENSFNVFVRTTKNSSRKIY